MAKRYLKRLFALSVATFGTLSAVAVPPKPGILTISQPDGSTFEARIKGDAGFSWYETPDGTLMASDLTDGFARPVSETELLRLRAEAEQRRLLNEEEAAVRRAARVAPNPIKRDFPTTGTVRGLIVLAEFQDVKFQPGSTQEYFDTKVNTPGYSGPETYGSVNDFFKAQSKGVFTPEFDIVGPVTLPKNRADYGLVEDLDGLFRDSAKGAQEIGTDFTRYDINGDHFVDFFFVVFAGHGEAQGGGIECVWPAMKDVTEYVFEAFDGMYLGVAACSCELKGGQGTDLDGVSTICHEFSHILGLPDTYDPMGTGGYGMGHFDMMCYGPYNDDGRTPCNYTAMEKFTLGWIEPKVLAAPAKDLTLANFGDTDECYFIVNPNNPNEYYTLENRQLIGFDHALPGHGLVISYCSYDKSIWVKNAVNSSVLSRYEHVSIIPADGTRNMELLASEAADPWPGTTGATEFTDTTRPGALWFASGQPVGMPLTNIRESEDGIITFDFMQDSGISLVGDDDSNARYFSMQGIEVEREALTPGMYIRRAGSESRIVMIK